MFEPEGSFTMSYPPKLSEIISLFESLPDPEKRDMLIVFADSAGNQVPRSGETFDLEDVRKDEECTDTVGIFLRVDPDSSSHFRVSLGPQVQTLTKAMTSILCKGLEGISPQELLDVPADFVPRIVGADLVRQRSQTVYYILTRMKSAARVWLNRQRALNAAASA
jgi:cysteine desulfuration protein SufE